MAIEILVAAKVDDATEYATYREQVMPILHRLGGEFGLDMDVSRVRLSPLAETVNRVFTLRFPSQEQRQQFFSDPGYLQVRQRYFDRAVSFHAVLLECEQTLIS